MHRPSPPAALRRLAPATMIAMAALVFAMMATAIAAPARGAAIARSGLRTWSTVFARPATPVGARPIGRVPGATVLKGVVALKPRDPAALAAYASAVTTPRSPLYEHYLASGQFADRFGPRPATIAAVENHLRADGVRVTGVSGNGLLVNFTAKAAAAQAAFGTRLERYRLADGATAFAPTRAVALPASIAPAVQTVLGLNTTARPVAEPLRGRRGAGPEPAVKAPATADGPKACPAARADAATYGGLTDQQIAYSYGVDGLYNAREDGAGQTIAVYELEPFNRNDIRIFDTCYFGASKAAAMLKRLTVVPVDGGGPIGYGSGESELDIDDVSAVAPGANIEVYEAPNTYYGLVDEFNAIVQDDTAKVATSSWASGCEAGVQAFAPGIEPLENTIFEQAAIQGQTVLDWAGDDGSDGCAIHGNTPVPPILSQNVEGDQPYVLSVGGTTITDPTFPPAEQVWNDGSNWGAGGGGISQVWPAPSWQTGSHVPGFDNAAIVKRAEAVAGTDFCGAAVCREVPDVTAQADEFTGAITVYESPYGGWTTFGGTSSSTPLWASMLTDTASTPACEANGGLGFVPPKLYAIGANKSEDAASFNDITKGNNDVFDDAGGLFPATKGYDMASGLGSPRVTAPGGGKGLAYYLCAAPSATAVAVTSVSPEAVPQTGGTTTISGSGFETAKGASDVAAVQVGSVNLPSADFTVEGPGTIALDLPSSAGEAGTGDVSNGTGTYAVMVTLTDGQSSKLGPATRLTYYATTGSPEALPSVVGVGIPGGNKAGGQVVTVYGSGFQAGTGTPSVTFGGVTGSDVSVLSDSELKVTVPAYAAGVTKCATKLSPATDICQVEVQVRTSNGVSAESTILPEYTGPAVGGTGEEIPAATEFDYFPTPRITGISVTGGLASEAGGSIATITGVGLGELDLDWYNVGPYQYLDSENYSVNYYSGTSIQVVLPAEAATTSYQQLPVTVQAEGSLNNRDLKSKPPSNSVPVTYAPTPVVSSIEVLRHGSAAKYDAGPSTGGAVLVIKGKGLQVTNSVQFTDVGPAGAEFGFSTKTAFTLGKVSATSVTLTTPGDQPGIDQVSACDVSGCSAALSSGDTFTYYPLGTPKVSSVSVAKGKAGTKVTIDGSNLGFVEAVYFGKVKAKTFANVPALLDCGSTTQLTAVVPPGKAGSKVEIRVVTLESEVTGTGQSARNPKVTFTYKK
jgi:Pro-kumamolisin, activation domain/IPT/TIG domain